MPTEITLSDEVRSLSLIPMFKQLDNVELEKLAELMEQVSFKAGQMVFHQHDPGDALYIVESGAVRLWVLDEDAKQVTLSELQAGNFCGELAVLDNGERSANATTLTDTVLHKLRSDHFQEFLLQHPAIAVDVIREIGRRMRQTNQLVSQRISRNVNVEMAQKRPSANVSPTALRPSAALGLSLLSTSPCWPSGWH
jgi:CRP-like cAMP-binding protein